MASTESSAPSRTRSTRCLTVDARYAEVLDDELGVKVSTARTSNPCGSCGRNPRSIGAPGSQREGLASGARF